MSNVFDAYAHYYDLLYRDKDYAAEAEYVKSHLVVTAPSTRRILELGCGTGAHAEHLARMGYYVCGIDISPTMLVRAEERRRGGEGRDIEELLSFREGDVRNIRTDETFDAVISLFHVMSYQTTEADLLGTFQTASSHLRSGGMFMFDFWYGPGVLSQKPEARVKRLEDETMRVIRIAEPEMFPNMNVVEVNYQVLIELKTSNLYKKVTEKHRMRYWFIPELEYHLCNSGFSCVGVWEWLKGVPTGLDTWAACIVAVKL